MSRPSRLVHSLVIAAALCPVAAGAQAPSDSARVRRWREDLRFMVSSLREIHPKLFAHVSEARFDSAVAGLDARIPRLSDPEVAVELMRLSALPADGHTSLIATMPQCGFRGYFPVRLYPFEDGIRVLSAAAAYAPQVGRRVSRIGELPAEEALERAAAITGGDNDRSRRDRATLYLMMPAALKALGIARDTLRLRIEVEGVAGPPSVFEVSPVSAEGQPNWYYEGEGVPGGSSVTMREGAPGRPPLDQRAPERAWWFEYFPERRMVYFQFRRVEPFDSGETFGHFVARMFAFADSVQADRFVVDIRHDHGGNNLILQPLIHGFIKRDSLDRRGHLFTIIGRETFSAAMNCANWLEEHTNTLFVGEPTGGRPNHFGDARTLELPHSKALLFVSQWPWQARLPWDDRVWIAPQLVAPPEVEAWRANRDPALEAIFEYLDHGTLAERLRGQALAGGHEAAAAAYRAYKERFPDRWGSSSETELLEIGRELGNDEKQAAAIAVYQVCVEAYRQSVGAHVRLGEAYLVAGQRDQALIWCRKALAMSPESRSARILMQRIEGAR